MKRLIPAAVLFACLAVSGSTPSRASESSARSQFESMLTKVSAAETKRNLAAWTKIVSATSTPDSIFIGPDGRTYNMQQSIEAEKQMMAATDKVTTDSYIVKSFSTKGKTATAIVYQSTMFITTDKAGEMGPKGATHTVSQSGIMTFHLVESGGAWKSKSITVSNAKMTLDGKPFNPQAMAPPQKPSGNK